MIGGVVVGNKLRKDFFHVCCMIECHDFIPRFSLSLKYLLSNAYISLAKVFRCPKRAEIGGKGKLSRNSDRKDKKWTLAFSGKLEQTDGKLEQIIFRFSKINKTVRNFQCILVFRRKPKFVNLRTKEE